MLWNINKTMWVIPKGLLFSPLNLMFFKNSKCIVFLQNHRTQLHLNPLSLLQYLLTWKLNHLLRKITCRHLWVSTIHAVSLKGIEQLVLKQQTYEVCKTFPICTTLSKYQYLWGTPAVKIVAVSLLSKAKCEN